VRLRRELAAARSPIRGCARHVCFFADVLSRGAAPRLSGGEGILRANYIAAQFKLLGLAPGAGDGSYFQMVTMVESKTDAGKGLTISGGAGAPEVLTPIADTVRRDWRRRFPT
jgi:hypothetical protein